MFSCWGCVLEKIPFSLLTETIACIIATEKFGFSLVLTNEGSFNWKWVYPHVLLYKSIMLSNEQVSNMAFYKNFMMST